MLMQVVPFLCGNETLDEDNKWGISLGLCLSSPLGKPLAFLDSLGPCCPMTFPWDFLCEAFLMYDYPLALPVSRFKFWFGQDVVLDLIVFESILHFNWEKRYPTLPFDFHQWWLVFSFYWCDLLHTEIISRNTSRYFSTVRKKPSNWKRKFRWAWRQSKIWF